MDSFGVDLRKIRLEVEKLVKSGPDMVTMGRLPQTPRTRKVIEYSAVESNRLGDNHIGTEHMLLGLLREQEGVASQVLSGLGVQLEAIRAGIFSSRSKRSGDWPQSAAKDCEFTIKLKSEPETQFIEQIVNQNERILKMNERLVEQLSINTKDEQP